MSGWASLLDDAGGGCVIAVDTGDGDRGLLLLSSVAMSTTLMVWSSLLHLWVPSLSSWLSSSSSSDDNAGGGGGGWCHC